MPIKHTFVSNKTDSVDATLINPSDWNESHTIDIFVDDETPTGSINGINVTFILANTPSPVSSLQVFLDGILQVNGLGYTLSGTTITMAEAPTLGGSVKAWYRKA